jgi:CysZ protein
MSLITGISYNIKGLLFGLKTPQLLFLGLIRFFITIGITLVAVGVVLFYHNEILSLLWVKPQSSWIIWFWYFLSWLLTLLLIVLSAVFSYLLSQILFSIWIMDKMARITESLIGKKGEATPESTFRKQLVFLISQELPRTIIPVLITFLIMVIGWFTPLGPIITIFGPAIATIFIAWDNTDLIPARRLLPFKARFTMLLNSLPFHLGFGLLFLIPLVNILFLSFAPVGATLYHIEKRCTAETAM